MITTSPQVAETINNIYQENTGNINEKVNPVDLIELGRILNTYNVIENPLKTSLLYWNFLDAFLDSIENGFWSSEPFAWFEVICVSKHRVMSENQIQAFYTLYLKKREKLCNKIGINPSKYFDKHLLLYWLRMSKGELYMIQVANMLMRAYLFFEKVEVPFLMNGGATTNRSFSNANQNIWPLSGSTKQQVLGMNFRYPYPFHDRFI